ncbi:tripartite tricarboxylate transporter TctB family protein [uncultured Mailhella sp.]|uniref:tripartite tricarboxylate transporter TctB family protein n=1 Tax=uncultured Mailhella sp. TaxID=1981031 RepID=UPI00320A30D2
MRLPRAALRRHALRVLLALAAVAVLAAAPPALSAGLPGPGIWPRIVGAGLFVGALLLPPASAAKERPSRKALREAGGLLFSCLLWMLLVYAAGWLPATFFAALCACRCGGCSRNESLALALLLCLTLWLGMEKLLAWPLPQGALFSFGIGA